MFEFTGNKGVAIDPSLLNVVCTHKIPLSRYHLTNPPHNRSAYQDDALMTVFDFVLPSAKTPIIALTLHDGIGYAQISYKNSSGEKRARVWILISPSLIKKTLNIDEPRHSDDFIHLICDRLKITAYIYDINPPPSRVNYGLEVYNENGELVFDSEYPPMKIGKKSNINDGKHMIFINRFFALHYESVYSSTSMIDVLDVRQCQPFMEACYQGKIYDFGTVLYMSGLWDEFNHRYHYGRHEWYMNIVENNSMIQSIIGYL